MELPCQPTVMLRNLRTCASTAGMAEERQVPAGRETDSVVEHGELAELHEVVAAPARPQLGPGAILQSGRDDGDVPVAVHDIVLAPRSERGAHSELGLPLDRSRQAWLLVGQRAHRQIQHGHLHPACDVDTDGVRDDRFVGGQDTADGQPVADVRIRHERARDSHRQFACVLQLLHRIRLEIAAPNLVRSVALSWLEGSCRGGVIEELPSQAAIPIIVDKLHGRRGHTLQIVEHCRDAVLGRVSLLQDLFGPVGARACGNADVHQLPCFHEMSSITKRPQQRPDG